MAFSVLCFSQLGLALALRSEQKSIFALGLLSNKYMLGSLVITLSLHFMIVYVPFFNTLFSTEPLSIKELGITLLVSSIVFSVVETQKQISFWWAKNRLKKI
jgi:P-type Ca2+ transporter type 2C